METIDFYATSGKTLVRALLFVLFMFSYLFVLETFREGWVSIEQPRGNIAACLNVAIRSFLDGTI